MIGTPTRDGFITQLRLRARASNGNTVAVNWGAVALTDESTAYPNGVVSFTYDDSYLSHWTEARKALDKQVGYVGTFYDLRPRGLRCQLDDHPAVEELAAGWARIAAQRLHPSPTTRPGSTT